MDLPPDVYGYFVPSRIGNNYGSLEFNLAKLSDPPRPNDRRPRELLHLGQALHDNSNRWTKARTASDRYWLDKACAVWCEKEACTGNASYRSTVAASHQMKLGAVSCPRRRHRRTIAGYGITLSY